MSHLNELFDGPDVLVKKEFLQFTGSFKERGARYALMKLSPEQKKIGVIAASAGNHALALAYHGMKLNVPVTVVCPVTAPIMKVQKCRKLQANVIIHGEEFDTSRCYALKLAKEKGFLYINGYDHPDVIAGQGTIGLEILAEVPDCDAVIVPVGGGGLISGIARAVKSLKPDIEVIGVEAETCPGFSAALEAGKPVKIQSKPGLADGLAVSLVGPNAVETCKHLVDKMVTVSEDYIALSILRMVEMEKTVVEGGSAVCFAALLEGKLTHLRDKKKVVCVLSGGNIDTTILGRCLDRGLAADGRLMRMSAVVSDRPGGISTITDIISQLGAGIKDITHERAWIKGNVFAVKVILN